MKATDDDIRRLLLREDAVVEPDLDEMWARLRVRRQRARRRRLFVGLAVAAGLALALAGSFAWKESGPVVPSQVATDEGVTRELEQWMNGHVARLDPQMKSSLTRDLAALDTAVADLDNFTPRSNDQETTRAAQRERLVRRRIALLRQATEHAGTDSP